MNSNLELLKKELNADIAPRKNIDGNQEDNIGDDMAMAIYDGGDPNSRHN